MSDSTEFHLQTHTGNPFTPRAGVEFAKVKRLVPGGPSELCTWYDPVNKCWSSSLALDEINSVTIAHRWGSASYQLWYSGRDDKGVVRPMGKSQIVVIEDPAHPIKPARCGPPEVADAEPATAHAGAMRSPPPTSSALDDKRAAHDLQRAIALSDQADALARIARIQQDADDRRKRDREEAEDRRLREREDYERRQAEQREQHTRQMELLKAQSDHALALETQRHKMALEQAQAAAAAAEAAAAEPSEEALQRILDTAMEAMEAKVVAAAAAAAEKQTSGMKEIIDTLSKLAPFALAALTKQPMPGLGPPPNGSHQG